MARFRSCALFSLMILTAEHGRKRPHVFLCQRSSTMGALKDEVSTACGLVLPDTHLRNHPSTLRHGEPYVFPQFRDVALAEAIKWLYKTSIRLENVAMRKLFDLPSLHRGDVPDNLERPMFEDKWHRHFG